MNPGPSTPSLALELHQKHDPKRIVAIISEHHAYLLATLFATWKLGGVFTPLDYHVPRNILERTYHCAYLCLDTLDRICNLEHHERYFLSFSSIFFISR
jgi:hypothetical protein